MARAMAAALATSSASAADVYNRLRQSSAGAVGARVAALGHHGPASQLALSLDRLSKSEIGLRTRSSARSSCRCGQRHPSVFRSKPGSRA